MRARHVLLGAAPVACALLALAPGAHAGEVPGYGALAAGHVSRLPTAKIPASIAAREKVPGFFPVRQKFSSDVPVSARHITIATEQKQADAIREGSGSGNELEVGACMSEQQQSGHSEDDDVDVEAHEWTMGQMREVNLWPKSKDNEQGGVSAVHSEKVVETNGQVSLESVDAWVDPVTLGARLIGRASLPLTPVGSAVGGVKVYAARDERGPGARFVQFVVVRPATASSARSGTMMAIRQDGANAYGNGCGHLRITLVVGATNHDSALVIAPVEIASTVVAAPPPEAPMAALDDDEHGADDRDDLAEKKAKPGMKKRRFPRPKPSSPSANAAADEGAMNPMVERESRNRDMQIHLSVSQSAREKEPLLAVSFGWAGRESVIRTTEPAAPAKE